MRLSSPDDLGRRLVAFGILAVLLGAASGVLALIHLALPRLTSSAFAAAAVEPVDPRTALSGFLLYGMAAAALAVLGYGSIRRRRWTRPLGLVFAWTWLLSGLLALTLAIGLLDDLPDLAALDGTPPSPETELAIRIVVAAAITLGGILLPAAFVWAWSDRRVRATCERYNPRECWTDHCPLSVLALSVGFAATAVLSVPLALRPAVPVFGILVTGWAGVACTAVVAVVCAWLARETFRRTRAGWWGATLLVALVGVSSAWTLARVDPAEFYGALGYPPRQVEALALVGAYDGALWIVATTALTLASVGYMFAVRRHFR